MKDNCFYCQECGVNRTYTEEAHGLKRCNVCSNVYPWANMVDHPPHYGGADNTYEVIKVLEAWELDASFCLGNSVKYIARAGKKQGADLLEDLKKARWYLDREIARRSAK